jgi:hypothetical protein
MHLPSPVLQTFIYSKMILSPIMNLLAARSRILPLAALPAAAAPAWAADPGILPSIALGNLTVAIVLVLLAVFALYAYASLARFAPYHSWIYLYLVSLVGITWAAFLLLSGMPPADAVFILVTVTGLNLIVHVLRFDRIDIPLARQANPAPSGTG